MASIHAAHDGGRHRLCVGGRVGTCVRVFASGARFWKGPRKEVLGKGTREGMCLLSDAGGKRAGKEMLGKGQGKEHARLLTRLGMCAGEGR